MRWTFFLLVLLVFPAYSFADTRVAIKEAGSLVKDKKYLSAFKLLSAADPDSISPEVTIARTSLVIKYFLHSINCRMFALDDLKPQQSVEQLRGKSGKTEMVLFDPGEVLGKLIQAHPANWALHKSLGDYYWFVSDCGPNSLEGIDPALKAAEHYGMAYDNGVFDWESLFTLGVYSLRNKQYDRGIKYLEQSLGLNDDYAASHYNLAYAYMYEDKHKGAMKHALRAYELYKTPGLKADAARMAATISHETGDNKKALRYYELSDKADPGNFYTLKAIIPVYLENNKVKKAGEKARELFNLDPKNPAPAQEMVQAYLGHPGEGAVLDVLEGLTREHQGNEEALGNLHFHIALYLSHIKQDRQSAEAAIKARGHFSKVFDEGHPVFAMIEEIVQRAER